MSEVMAGQPAPLTGEIESVTDASEHLRTIGELVERNFTPEQQGPFRRRIAGIERRAADPHLNLAVIGEFSSGKSTFINALLRFRLLKAACVATTGSVTRICKGPALTVTATFTDGSTAVGSAADFSGLYQAVVARQPAAASDESLKELLDRLTSDPVVADDVRHVDVVMPSEQLADNIVILDTPGIGAGVDAAKNHGRVTQQVIDEVADCALVLVPAANPVTATLVSFLADYARPFLHRCIFVITAMDRQDEAERAETREYVRAKLRERLGLESPLVLEAAAITMLPAAPVPAHQTKEWAGWQSEFRVLEAAVQAALLRERSLIIAERLVRLLQELVAALKRGLAESAAALDAEEQVLRATSMATLDVVLGELQARSATDLERRRQAIKQQTVAARNAIAAATKEWAYGLIERAGTDIDSYQSRVHPHVTAALEHYGRQYVDTIDREVNDLRQRCEALSAEFARKFEESYRGLRSLGVAVAVPAVAIAPMPRAEAFSAAIGRAKLQALHGHRRGTVGGILGVLGGFGIGWLLAAILLGGVGAVVGAVVGSLVADGFGGCVGILAGGALGSSVGLWLGPFVGPVVGFLLGYKALSGGSQRLADRQRELRSGLAVDVDVFFSHLQRELDAHVDGAVVAVTDSLRKAVERHKQEFGGAVEALRRQHSAKEAAVALRIAGIGADTRDLNQRAARLVTIRRRLAHSRVPS